MEAYAEAAGNYMQAHGEELNNMEMAALTNRAHGLLFENIQKQFQENFEWKGDDARVKRVWGN